MDKNAVLRQTPSRAPELLALFRNTHHTTEQAIDGHCWEYTCSGAGQSTILILPGGLAASDTAFRYILRFEVDYQVIALTYPATICTMAELVNGLVQLLRSLNIERVYVIGGSYSGLVAQCLVRRVPPMVSGLALSDTGVPRPGRARNLGVCLGLVDFLPMAVVRPVIRLSVVLFVRSITTDRSFWSHYFSERIDSLSKQACMSLLRIWIDFDRHYRFAPDDLWNWAGRILVIEAERDRLFQPSEQDALKYLYATAEQHIFHGSPHSASLERMDEYISVIAECFERWQHDE